MKICVINPGRVKGAPVTREDRLEYVDYGEVFPSLTLLYTAAILQKKYRVEFIEASGFDLDIGTVRKKIQKFSPDVLIARLAIDTIPQDARVFQIAKEVNSKCLTLARAKIIADSPLLLNEVLSKYKIDYFIMGELEVVVPEIIEAKVKKKDIKEIDGIAFLEKGKLEKTKEAKRIENLDELPFPAYNLLPNIKCYRTGTQRPVFTTLFSSRGCPFSCKFCSSHDTYQARNPENVVKEITWLVNKYHLKNLYFFDDIFTINQDRVIKLCREMRKHNLKVRWSCGTRVDCVSKELLKEMKEAGCWQICYGVESGVPSVLEKNAKGYKLEQAIEANKLTKEAGIFSYIMLVLGLPGETKKTMQQTVDFVHELHPDYAQYCIAVPFPNTPFYDEYHKNGWITSYDWTKYNPLGYPVISTPEISDEELSDFRYHAYKKFLLRPSFLIKKINLRDWHWNIVGVKFLFDRMKAIFSKSLIR